MSLRLVMTRTREANRVLFAALKAQKLREHREQHISIARQMRDQADQIEAQIQVVKDQELDPTYEDEDTRTEWIDQATKHVLHLRTGAIEQENATCLDEH